MARHHLRFSPKLWLGMAAAIGLTLTMSTPASAETIELICRYGSIDAPIYGKIFIDLDRQTAVNASPDGVRHGPFAASISDTLIRWTIHTAGSDWERQYIIDRVAGTIRDITTYRGEQKAAEEAQCRRATQKF